MMRDQKRTCVILSPLTPSHHHRTALSCVISNHPVVAAPLLRSSSTTQLFFQLPAAMLDSRDPSPWSSLYYLDCKGKGSICKIGYR